MFECILNQIIYVWRTVIYWCDCCGFRTIRCTCISNWTINFILWCTWNCHYSCFLIVCWEGNVVLGSLISPLNRISVCKIWFLNLHLRIRRNNYCVFRCPRTSVNFWFNLKIYIRCCRSAILCKEVTFFGSISTWPLWY